MLPLAFPVDIFPVFFSLEPPRVFRPVFPAVDPALHVPPVDDVEAVFDEDNTSFPVFVSSFADAAFVDPEDIVVHEAEDIFCFFRFVSSSLSSI